MDEFGVKNQTCLFKLKFFTLTNFGSGFDTGVYYFCFEWKNVRGIFVPKLSKLIWADVLKIRKL